VTKWVLPFINIATPKVGTKSQHKVSLQGKGGGGGGGEGGALLEEEKEERGFSCVENDS